MCDVMRQTILIFFFRRSAHVDMTLLSRASQTTVGELSLSFVQTMHSRTQTIRLRPRLSSLLSNCILRWICTYFRFFSTERGRRFERAYVRAFILWHKKRTDERVTLPSTIEQVFGINFSFDSRRVFDFIYFFVSFFWQRFNVSRFPCGKRKINANDQWRRKIRKRKRRSEKRLNSNRIQVRNLSSVFVSFFLVATDTQMQHTPKLNKEKMLHTTQL